MNYNQNINKLNDLNKNSNQINNKNINSSVILNTIIPSSTIKNLKDTTNQNLINSPSNSDLRFYDNLFKSNSQTNINNYHQQNLLLNNKVNNMDSSFMDNLSATTVSPMLNNINNKVNIMDMSHNNNNNNSNTSNTPKLFNNKEDNGTGTYYLSSLNNGIGLTNFLNGNDASFLNKKDILESPIPMNNSKFINQNSNREYYLSNLNDNFNNTSIGNY